MEEPPLMMACRKCGEEKPLREMKRNYRQRFGVEKICKECCRLYSAAWYSKPENAIRQAARLSEQRPWLSDKLLERHRQWRANNREHVRNYARTLSRLHREFLSRSYIRALLVDDGKITRAKVSPEMEAIKREQVTYRRIARSIRSTLKEQHDETQPDRS